MARVQGNQQAPLLRLPPEIRDRIWRYALGGKTFVGVGLWESTYRFGPSKADPENGAALLRTCRQIYSETALHLPRLGNFVYATFSALKRSARKLKRYQHNQVIQLCLSCPDVTDTLIVYKLRDRRGVLENFFPALEQIELLIHAVPDQEDSSFRAKSDVILKDLSYVFLHTDCALRVKGTPAAMEI